MQLELEHKYSQRSGKAQQVVYGEKRTVEAGKFIGHVDQLATSVQELARMESSHKASSSK